MFLHILLIIEKANDKETYDVEKDVQMIKFTSLIV